MPGEEIMYQILSDVNYAYGATSSGLKIFDIETGSLGARVYYDGGFTTVAGNSTTLYLGTSNSGILYMDKSSIVGFNISSPVTLTSISGFKTYPDLTNNNIIYIHVNEDQLLTTTEDGVDYFKMTGNPTYRSFTTISGAGKCFMTTKKAYYITVSGAVNTLNVLNNCVCDWSTPDIVYVMGSSGQLPDTTLTDVFITEATASNGVDNCIFMATNSGIHVIDEYTSEMKSFYIS